MAGKTLCMAALCAIMVRKKEEGQWRRLVIGQAKRYAAGKA